MMVRAIGMLCPISFIVAMVAGCNIRSDPQSVVEGYTDTPGSATHQSRIPHKVQLRHPGINANALGDYTLYQMRSGDGLITGYAMVVNSVACLSGNCKVVGVTLRWDALGEYDGYSLADGTALEKVEVPAKGNTPSGDAGDYKGVPFTDADYEKLDRILNDKVSALRTQKLDDLTSVRAEPKVDAVTMATPLSLQKAVVEGAALSCYHLWHWANGEVGSVARALTLRSGDDVAALFAESSAAGRVRLMGAMDSSEDLSDKLLEEMGKVLKDMDSYYEVHLFLSLLEKHGYLSPSLLTLVSELLEDENFFIARRAYWYLEKQAVDEDTANDIRIFREKSMKDGRILK